MNKKHSPIIVLLMLITGLLIYYLYMKPENFETTVAQTTSAQTTSAQTTSAQTTSAQTTSAQTTRPQTTRPQITCPPAAPTVPLSVVSRYFGIGFNIYPANNTNQATVPTSMTNENLFLIEHIPIVYNNTLGSMYAMSSDGQLTIKLRNDQDPTQWWVLTPRSDSNSTYYVITPFTQGATEMALQYENGNLALRPYTSPGFEGQKWISSNNKVTRGIPVLNYNPASLFTPEFDPYSSTNNVTSTSLSQQNSQQVSEVMSAIKANIQQYLTQIGSSQDGVPKVTASSLGNKEMPLNINLNLGSSRASGGSTLSAFANIDGTTTPNDILSLLSKYENTTGTNDTQYLYSTSDIQSALNNNSGCPYLNIGDYTSNRVSTCNCKL